MRGMGQPADTSQEDFNVSFALVGRNLSDWRKGAHKAHKGHKETFFAFVTFLNDRR